MSESRNRFQSYRGSSSQNVEVHIPAKLSVIGVTKSIGLAVGVNSVTKSVDIEGTAEAGAVVTLVRAGVDATAVGSAPESAILKRAAAGKTRRIARFFILSVICDRLTVR